MFCTFEEKKKTEEKKIRHLLIQRVIIDLALISDHGLLFSAFVYRHVYDPFGQTCKKYRSIVPGACLHLDRFSPRVMRRMRM